VWGAILPLQLQQHKSTFFGGGKLKKGGGGKWPPHKRSRPRMWSRSYGKTGSLPISVK